MWTTPNPNPNSNFIGAAQRQSLPNTDGFAVITQRGGPSSAPFNPFRFNQATPNPAVFHHLEQSMDEVDFGILLLDTQGRLLHANHIAKQTLNQSDPDSPLSLIELVADQLVGCHPTVSGPMGHALTLAYQGQRRLVVLQHRGLELALAYIPLFAPNQATPHAVLVHLPRQNSDENLALRMYARLIKLSSAEEHVLIQLCRGDDIADIATANHVAESTVRSQIKSLREKSNCPSIRQLLLRVNALPPVTPSLRSGAHLVHNRVIRH